MTPNSELKTWISGIPYELAFWNNIYRWDSTFEGVTNWCRLGKSIQLEGFDAITFLSQFSQPIVLDVGCGISYAKGDQLPTQEGLKPLEVHYIDPLASYYNEIMKRHHREMPKVEFGMMEHLACTHKREGIKLVIIQNALDHSSNPLAGILQSLHVLDIGGCLYLNHHPNEAETEHYKGFHKFNICTDDDHHLLIWNHQHRTVVDDLITPFATIQTTTLPNGFVVSTLIKTADVTPHLIDSQSETANLVKDQMMLIDLLQHPHHAIGLKLKYWYYNMVHFFVQSLPREKRMKLRTLVYSQGHKKKKTC